MQFYDAQKGYWRNVLAHEKLTFYDLKFYYLVFENSYNSLLEELEYTTINQTIYFKQMSPSWLTPFEYAIMTKNEILIHLLMKKEYHLNIDRRISADNKNIFHLLFQNIDNTDLLNQILKFIINNINYDLNLLSAKTTNNYNPLEYTILKNTLQYIEKDLLQYLLLHVNGASLINTAIERSNSEIIYVLLENNISFSQEHIDFANERLNSFQKWLQLKTKNKVIPFCLFEDLQENIKELNLIIYYLKYWKIELLWLLWTM